jgi:hypothetical protein
MQVNVTEAGKFSVLTLDMFLEIFIIALVIVQAETKTSIRIRHSTF